MMSSGPQLNYPAITKNRTKTNGNERDSQKNSVNFSIHFLTKKSGTCGRANH
jgi:hypothetical protein